MGRTWWCGHVRPHKVTDGLGSGAVLRVGSQRIERRKSVRRGRDRGVLVSSGVACGQRKIRKQSVVATSEPLERYGRKSVLPYDLN